jgi:TPR repeat protein
VLHQLGRGVRKDAAAALDWCRKAAAGGDANAQYDLGLLHLAGDGVPHDEAEAVRLFQAAARQRHALACYNLGILYATGQGVARDDGAAHVWLSVAAESAEPAVVEPARRGLAQVMARLGTAGIAAARRRRAELLPGGAS